MPAIDKKLTGNPNEGLTPTSVSAQERVPSLDPKVGSTAALTLLPGLAAVPLAVSIPALAGAAAVKWYLDKGKNFATEQSKLAQIEKNLNALHTLAPEEKEKCVLALYGLALHYLEQGQSKQNNSAEIFSEDHSKLAAQAFDILGRFADADAETSVKARAPLYQGYALLAAGQTAAALKKFESLRGKIPEADAILKQSDADTLVGMNLALLDVWEVRNAEGDKIMEDEIHSVGGFVTGVIDSLARGDKKTIQHDNAESIALENQLVLALRRRLQKGEAKTVQEALAQIQAKGPEELKAKATVYLTAADNTIGMLVKYSAKFPTDPTLARVLIENTFHYESTQGAQQTPYAIYSFLHATSEDSEIQKATAGHIKAFEGDTDFGRAILKIRQSVSLPELAMEVAVMGGCFRLGKLAQAASLARLSGNGIRAVILSRGAGFLTTGTALWAWGTAKGVMQHNPKEVLKPEKLAKSYGATLIMLGMTRGFEVLGGSLAKMIMGGAETAHLTIGQKILVSSFGMGFGLAGMIASTQTNQAFKLHEKPVGGWKESVASDVLNFLEFAAAHKLGDAAGGGKINAAAEKQQIEIMKQEWVELRTWAIDKIAKTISGIPQKTEQALHALALSDGFETLMGLMGEAVAPNAKADSKTPVSRTKSALRLLQNPMLRLAFSFLGAGGIGGGGEGARGGSVELSREKLIGQAKSTDEATQKSAITELLQRKDPVAIEMLKGFAIHGETADFRTFCLNHLAERFPEEAIPILINRLEFDKDIPLCILAARSLGKLPSTESRIALEKALLMDHDASVQVAAAQALKALGDPAALPALFEAMRNEKNSDQVWAEAAITARKLAAKHPEAKKADPTGSPSSGGKLMSLGPISLLGLEQFSPDASLGIGMLVGGALVVGGMALYKVLRKKAVASTSPTPQVASKAGGTLHNLHSPHGYQPFRLQPYQVDSNFVLNGIIGTVEPNGTRPLGDGQFWWVTLKGHNGGYYKGYFSPHQLQDLGLLAADGKILTKQEVEIHPFRRPLHGPNGVVSPIKESQPQSPQALIDKVNSKPPEEQRKIVAELFSAKNPLAIEVSKYFIANGQDPLLQRFCLDHLSASAPKEALPVLVETLKNYQPALRRAAVLWLKNDQGPQALEALNDAMDLDPDVSVRLLAAEMLYEINFTNPVRKEISLRFDQVNIIRLIKIGSDTSRRASIVDLFLRNDPMAIEYAKHYAKQGDTPEFRSFCLFHLTKQNPAEALPVLVDRLGSDPNRFVREMAAHILFLSKTREARDALEHAWKTEKDPVVKALLLDGFEINQWLLPNGHHH